MALLLLALLPAWAAHAIEVEQARWGFDGRVSPRRFTLLSVLLHNPDAQTWQGTITLEPDLGIRYELDTTLSPGSRRWVQFTPFVSQPFVQWKMRWSPGPAEPYVLNSNTDPSGNAGDAARERARVLLDGGGLRASRPSALPRFPDELFPASVVVLDDLEALVIDHVPRWSPAQAQALLDWVRTGGRLFLAPNEDGKTPQFSDDLAILNAPLEVRRLGAGMVRRLDMPAAKATLADLGLGVTAPAQTGGNNVQFMQTQADATITALLRRLTQPAHAWQLIFTLAVVYLLLVGPLNAWAGRKLNDFRLAIGLLLALAVGFSAVFYVIGRRGYDESATTYTIALARPLDDAACDVTQWIQVFVTRGDHYTLTHPSPHNLYAPTAMGEETPGTIRNGKDGRFITDIPLYSYREFLHRGRMVGAPTLNVARVSDDKGRISLRHGASFPKKPLAIWAAVDRSRFVTLKVDEDGTLSPADGIVPLSTAIALAMSEAQSLQWGRRPRSAPGESIEAVVERHAVAAAKVVLAKALNVEASTSAADMNAKASAQSTASPPMEQVFAAHVDLFILDRAPDSFALKRTSPGLGREVGFALYHLTLPEDRP